MDPNHLLIIRVTIWAAVAGYAVAVLRLLRAPGGEGLARAAWTAGCAAFLLHTVAAFHLAYGWSHATGLEETGRQTLELLTGVEWSGGLYFNYAFGALWLADCLWWWRGAAERYRKRGRVAGGILHAFMFAMIFNGTVVFAEGVSRWIGVVVSVLIAGAFLRSYLGRASGD